MRRLRLVCLALLTVLVARTAAAQQRPLVTEDPEPIGAGRVLIEGGLDYSHDEHYPVSGLDGNLWRFPALGVSVGISSIAELQIDSGFDHLGITSRKPAPLSNLLTVTGDSTHDVDDIVIATKIRLRPEAVSRPALGIRFATKLPTASNESGLGLDTTDFFVSLLGAKTVESIRIVGNIGVGILGDRPRAHVRTTFSLTAGRSLRALTQQVEVVGELNGRVSTRSGAPFPNRDTRSAEVRRTLHEGSDPVRCGSLRGFDVSRSDGRVHDGVTYVFNASPP